MISVSRFAKPQQRCYVIQNVNGSHSLSPAFSWTWGAICILTDTDGQAPKLHTRNFDLGWLKQGLQPWGKLRDKEVSHLSSKGHVMVSALGMSAATPTSTQDDFHAGIKYTYGGTVTETAAIVPWGQDWSGSTSINTYFPRLNNTIDAMVGPLSYGVTAALHFDGDVGVFIKSTSAYSYKVKYRYAPFRTEIVGVPAKSTCQILRLNSPGKPGTLYTSGLVNGIVGSLDGEKFILANGGTYTRDALLGGPLHPSMGAATNPMSAAATTIGFEAEVLAVYDTVCRDLEQGGVLPLAMSVFNNNPCRDDWGDLGSEVLKQRTYVDANLLLTVYDLVNIRAAFKSWKSLVLWNERIWLKLDQGFTSIRQLRAWCLKLLKDSPGRAGSSFLGVDYGILPTVRDMEKVVRGALQLYREWLLKPSRLHARRTSLQDGYLSVPVVTTRVLTCETPAIPAGMIGDPNLPATMQGIEYLHRWGLYPDLKTAYDFIPFSFAFDWMVNIGSVVEDFNDVYWRQYFPVNYVIFGETRTWAPPAARIWPRKGVTGHVVFRHYARWLSGDFPLPLIQIDEATGLFSHMAEATALVVTRRRSK